MVSYTVTLKLRRNFQDDITSTRPEDNVRLYEALKQQILHEMNLNPNDVESIDFDYECLGVREQNSEARVTAMHSMEMCEKVLTDAGSSADSRIKALALLKSLLKQDAELLNANYNVQIHANGVRVDIPLRVYQAVHEMKKNGEMIYAIKTLRAEKGFDFKTAKEVYESQQNFPV